MWPGLAGSRTQSPVPLQEARGSSSGLNLRAEMLKLAQGGLLCAHEHTDICSSLCFHLFRLGVLACLFFSVSLSQKAPELHGISPLTLHPRKLQCTWRSDLPGSGPARGGARPRPPDLTKHGPSCQPASSSGPSLRPAG